jgi:transcriptional regulator with XRE-family HTH domain
MQMTALTYSVPLMPRSTEKPRVPNPPRGYKHIGEWLKELRDDAVKSLRDVEEMTVLYGVEYRLERTYLQKLEKNERTPSQIGKKKLEALRLVYRQNLEDWEDRLGITIPPGARLEPATFSKHTTASQGGGFVIYKIPVLLSDGNISGSVEVVVPEKYRDADLLAFYSDNQTVHGIEPGRGVYVERGAKPQQAQDIVLVRGLGQRLLAYAVDIAVSKVVTSQGLEFEPDEVIGVMVSEIPRAMEEFRGQFKA